MNAIDFLHQASSDFKERPKSSVINFYAAVELMLKARLFAEHWTLVVSKQTTRRKFEDGDFQSVTFEDAVQRLRKVVGTSISDDARCSFDVVRRHRNKMVHFFHGGDKSELEKIAEEQLRAWYHLNQLLTTTWCDVFAPYASEIEAIERSLQSQRDYLRAKFTDVAPRIEKLRAQGAMIVDCKACGFESATVDELLAGLFQSMCLVCHARRTWFMVECICGEVSEFAGDGEPLVCSKCGTSEDADELLDRLNEEFTKPDEASLARTPANCGQCDGYRTVIERDGQYLCLGCLDSGEALEQCEWCAEYSTGDLSDSYLLGCGNCEGQAGWHKADD